VGFVRRLFRHLLPGRKWHVAIRVEAADEIPDTIPALGAVMVGTDADPKWLAFDCPCETGHMIMLNLDRRRSPSWIVVNPRRLTIKPSVDARRSERRCHYLVCQGKVKWVPDIDTETQDG
jgi:hypothetical protein